IVMEHEDKVSELNLTEEEMEIAILEQDRGNSVQFIHPTPFKCVRTSVNGKLKCYVNVCANDKIARPSCKYGVSEDGKSGHHWSLPHSLHPERKEMDAKGNKLLIYDVIFHPDTLHMASTNERFMDMVTSVALEGIQDAFNVRLDKNNIRNMKTKYKGNPQACVIRKPIPGFQNSQSQSKMFQKSQEPTKPDHTIKYRSFIDLQDFRCSRDSMLATTLEVKEKSLLLESRDPAYKLELNLAYAVDEDKGEAKFNNHTRQLVVTLPLNLQVSNAVRHI
uniref:PIH1 domain containing 2 n=1 Tax=Neogobius melanostomus TaxID=47308 RepID=A0A8C6U2U8_9GOBI